MNLFIPSDFSTIVRNRYLFIDNDFLNLLFKSEEFLEGFFKVYQAAFLHYDSLTGLEFLRDIFVQKERVVREQFLSLGIFLPATQHQSIFRQVSDNALILSKIYARNKHKPQTLDLLLAGKVMIYDPDRYLLITGNKKHFPECVWDLQTSISFYEPERYLNFSILKFNKEKFENEFNMLKSIDFMA